MSSWLPSKLPKHKVSGAFQRLGKKMTRFYDGKWPGLRCFCRLSGHCLVWKIVFFVFGHRYLGEKWTKGWLLYLVVM